MAVTFASLDAAYDNVDASSNVTGTLAPADGAFILAWIGTSAAAAATAPTVSSISALSLTWTQVDTLAYSGTGSAERRISLWRAQAGAGPGSGTATITLSGTSLGTAWSFVQVLGHDTATPIVQNPKANAAAATTLSITLASAANSLNRPAAGCFHRANEGKTPRTNWTELADVFGSSPSVGLETECRDDAFETTASWTWSTSQPSGGIAVEIAAASALAPPPYNPRNRLTGR